MDELSHIFRVFEPKRMSGKFLLSRLEIRQHLVLFVLKLIKFGEPLFSNVFRSRVIEKATSFRLFRTQVAPCRAECYRRLNSERGLKID